jgi:hypothetical protein
MKKLIILITLIITSCSFPTKKDYNKETINNIDIVIIDSCEYLLGGIGYSQMITHKGNCKNCKK